MFKHREQYGIHKDIKIRSQTKFRQFGSILLEKISLKSKEGGRREIKTTKCESRGGNCWKFSKVLLEEAKVGILFKTRQRNNLEK